MQWQKNDHISMETCRINLHHHINVFAMVRLGLWNKTENVDVLLHYFSILVMYGSSCSQQSNRVPWKDLWMDFLKLKSHRPSTTISASLCVSRSWGSELLNGPKQGAISSPGKREKMRECFPRWRLSSYCPAPTEWLCGWGGKRDSAG